MRYKSEARMKQIIDFVDAYYTEHSASPTIREISEAINFSKSSVHYYLTAMDEKGMLGYDGRNITTDRMSMTAPGKSMAALIGSVSCGEPLLEEEYVEKYIPLPKEIFGDGELFVLRANGDSMTGAGIQSGDYVVVRKQTDFEIGDIVVALVDNSETTLKRIMYDDYSGSAYLHPENPDYPDIPITDCRIQGVAVYVLKSLGASPLHRRR